MICAAIALLPGACTEPGVPWFVPEHAEAPANESLWETTIKPLFSAYACVASGCHAGPDPAAGLDATSVEALMIGGDNGPAIVPCDPDAGTLIGKLEKPPSFGLVMPLGVSAMLADEVAVIRDWITAGADVGCQSSMSELSWANDCFPILQAHDCATAVCHSAETAAAGLDITSVAGLKAGGVSGPTIEPCNPSGGTLLEKLQASPSFGMVMPPTGPLLNDIELAIITQWILEGANPEYDPNACPLP